MGLMSRLFGPNISKLESRGDVEGLVATAESEADTEQRVAAVEALARLAPEQTVPALVAMLGSDEPAVAAAAEAALAGMGGDATAALVEALDSPDGERALALLLQRGAAALEPLVETVGDGEEPARLRAMAGLVQLRDTMDESQDEDDGVTEQVFRAMLAALGDRAPAGRVLAAESLETLGDARASRALAAKLKDGDEAVREACRQALARIGEPAVPDLVDALRDRNANSRRLAAGLLGEVLAAGPDRDPFRHAVEALLDRVRDPDPAAREAVVAAIACIRAENLDRLVERQLELLAHPELGEPDQPLELLHQVLAHAPLEPGRAEAVRERITALGFAAEDQAGE